MWNNPAFALVGIGSYLAASIVLPTLLGRFLDARYETDPALTLLGLLLGLAAGLYGSYMQLRDFLRRANPPSNGRGS